LSATVSGAASSAGARVRIERASLPARAWPLRAVCCSARRLASSQSGNSPAARSEARVELVAQLGVEGLVGLFHVGQPDHARAPELVARPLADLPQGVAFAQVKARSSRF
jgi:hypothetical protein